MPEPIEIRLYDTLTKQKRALRRPEPGRPIGMYVCGPTVYDRAHIGNARPVVVFDLLARLIRHLHGRESLCYVRNVTDIEDKIIARAARDGEPIEALTARTLDWFHADMAALGAAPPDLEPRATAHIGGMIDIIERLIARDAAYAADGHVLFAVERYAGYGELSRRSLEDMIAGARVEVAPYKRNPMDFVLWKPSAPQEPGWPSPWGRGRPGWHIECSAMSAATLGLDFDIHGGGIDLAFPHHENERAQSLCAHPGSHFAEIWMHNGFVQVEGEKMSKSLGNFITVHDLAGRVPGRVIRLAMLTTHYRQPFDWTNELAKQITARFDYLASFVGDVKDLDCIDLKDRGPDSLVVASLCDDLNTPIALGRLNYIRNRWASEFNGNKNLARAVLLDSARLMGIRLEDGSTVREAVSRAMTTVDEEYLKKILSALLLRRSEARARKDFATSDLIRDGLSAAGVEVRDSKDGPSFEALPEIDLEAVARLAEQYGA